MFLSGRKIRVNVFLLLLFASRPSSLPPPMRNDTPESWCERYELLKDVKRGSVKIEIIDHPQGVGHTNGCANGVLCHIFLSGGEELFKGGRPGDAQMEEDELRLQCALQEAFPFGLVCVGVVIVAINVQLRLFP